MLVSWRLPSSHEKCHNRYTQETRVGGGKGDRGIRGGNRGPRDWCVRPSSESPMYVYSLNHLFCRCPNVPRWRHDAPPNCSVTHHIPPRNSYVRCTFTHMFYCLFVAMRLQDGSLSRLSYRQEDIRHNLGSLNLAAADDAAAHEEEAVYFRDTAVVVPASLTFERPRFFRMSQTNCCVFV